MHPRCGVGAAPVVCAKKLWTPPAGIGSACSLHPTGIGARPTPAQDEMASGYGTRQPVGRCYPVYRVRAAVSAAVSTLAWSRSGL